MKKRVLSLLLAMSMVVGLSACSGGTTKEETKGETTKEETKKEVPETDTIHWARANSGNIFVTLASSLGYFDEVGLTVIEDPVDSSTAAMTALSSGQVDVTSNQGSNMPLQNIASGQDFTIIGGYMMQGMYLVARKGTGWNGIEDLVGKKVAGLPNDTAYTGPFLASGHDPRTEIDWVECDTNSDRLAAVISGKADYANCSGDLHYTVDNNPDVEIVCYLDELSPSYGCCRMQMRTDFIKKNPTTVKLMLECLIRAEDYYRNNIDECVKILAKEIDADEDYVAAYLKNEHYVLSIDPVKNSVLKTWQTLLDTGFLDKEELADFDIESHINTDLYEEALNAVIEEHYDEDPEFYDERLAFFKEYNK